MSLLTNVMRNHIPLVLAALSPLYATPPIRTSVSAPPILFEPNLGQAPASALFAAKTRGFLLLLEQNGVVFDLGHRASAA